MVGSVQFLPSILNTRHLEIIIIFFIYYNCRQKNGKKERKEIIISSHPMIFPNQYPVYFSKYWFGLCPRVDGRSSSQLTFSS